MFESIVALVRRRRQRVDWLSIEHIGGRGLLIVLGKLDGLRWLRLIGDWGQWHHLALIVDCVLVSLLLGWFLMLTAVV